MHNFEIEIKSLLGSKANADALVEKMQTADNDFKILGTHKQLNHYFVGGSLKSLFDKVNHLLTEESKHKLEDLSERAKDFSVRTREADGKIILVVKATVDDTTSENGTARLEWEAKLNNLNLEELDKLILNAGFTYQAKWSRERQEFLFHSGKRELSVSIDKNAGYGFLAELEVVVNDVSKAEEVKAFIRETMSKLAIEELPQDRLQRMFDFYNKNWSEYYGTDKVFTIN
jgi:adenylate cyclase class IV